MTFRNATTATNQILGRITGVQHHSWKIRTPSRERSVFDKPLEFNEWLLKGMNYYYYTNGTEFETVCPGLMRIKMKNGKSFIRTLEDFELEYQEYVKKFYT